MTKALSMYDSKVKECYLNPWAHVLSICLTVLFSPYQSNEHYDYQGIILTCLKWCILCLMKCILIQVIWLCWKVDFNIGLYICSCINVTFSHVPILSSNIHGQAQEEEQLDVKEIANINTLYGWNKSLNPDYLDEKQVLG